ncbi:GyrI-like domain-containing protein [Pontibacter sp. G13]|uniref:GyrI-like domain-containing protein n=1 Tax=Pontibacter sp. G13 TaxID=3074898 RepID=UPI0028895875|nr:GyrI-like domain-containing protein [Pontibacter sp. G13]WNJ19086.1 GyrI-like domain-containing protein [Pontibacter sp. G13]
MNPFEQTAFRLIGLTLEGKTTNQDNQSAVDCGNLWQRFEQAQIFSQIPNKLNDAILAVYYDYDGDETQPFSYMIGCQVSDEALVPEGLNELKIPAQTYQKVEAKGALPACIGAAWVGIWNSQPDRAFGYDFEVYDERSKDWSQAEVDIFLSMHA